MMAQKKIDKIALFEGKRIRKTLHEGQWWFVIVDVVAALTDSSNPSGYLKDMRRRDPSLSEAFKLKTGDLVPYLGNGALEGIHHQGLCAG